MRNIILVFLGFGLLCQAIHSMDAMDEIIEDEENELFQEQLRAAAMEDGIRQREDLTDNNFTEDEEKFLADEDDNENDELLESLESSQDNNIEKLDDLFDETDALDTDKTTVAESGVPPSDEGADNQFNEILSSGEDELSDEETSLDEDNLENENAEDQSEDTQDPKRLSAIFRLTKPYTVVKGRRLKILTVQTKGWVLSLDIKPTGVTPSWGSVIHLTTGTDASRVPAIFFHGKSTRLHICSSISGNKNHCYNSPPLKLGKYTNVRITQTRIGKSKLYRYNIYICGLLVRSITNTKATINRYVQVYAGNPWYASAKAQIKNVLYTNLEHPPSNPVPTKGFRYTPERRITKNRLVTHVNHQSKAWTLSLDIKPLGAIKRSFSSIIHFTTGSDHGKHGYRTPAIWFLPGKTSLHICSTVGKNPNRCFNTPELPKKRFTNVRITQTQIGTSNVYHYKIYVCDMLVFSVRNTIPRSFQHVKVFSGDPWYPQAHAIIRNLVFINHPIRTSLPGVTICEHRTTQLRCKNGFVLRILSATYGRLTNGICGSGPNTKCRAKTSLAVTKRICNGKQSCTLKASNSVFGDPCVGTFKYLNVRHQCVRKTPLGLIRKNRIVGTVRVLAPYYQVSFDVKPLGVVNNWGNLIHLTIGGDHKNIGDRIPGVWFHSKTTKLHVCSAINEVSNSCQNPKLSLSINKFSKVIINQIFQSGKFYFNVFVNGKKIVSVSNRSPYFFQNVKIYNGDKWYNPARALIRNLKVQNLDTAQVKWLRALQGKKITLKSAHKTFLHTHGDNLRFEKKGGSVYTVKVVNSHQIALLSQHGKYVVAEPNGKVLANRKNLGPWEKFYVVFLAHNRIALLSHHRRYVVSEPNGEIKANRKWIQPWEIFEITIR